mmetsp:Transcript_1889/g.3563  ORF Transcript_1889/g.3563 Transcript_1889/m.3563 type:complete len:97 (-) Transcript_1889:82-372(-)
MPLIPFINEQHHREYPESRVTKTTLQIGSGRITSNDASTKAMKPIPQLDFCFSFPIAAGICTFCCASPFADAVAVLSAHFLDVFSSPFQNALSYSA